jgi:O-acetyl-ADP-ribose deacetylase (regulator of RNase III)
MIIYVVSDLFQSPAQVLVNAVNTVGVMGKGIAAEFRQFYPDMFEQYRLLCERGQFDIGQLWLYKTPHKWVLNFPTKRHWRDPSELAFIEAGLEKFVHTYADKSITSVSFPLLGSGLGGLDWESQVRPLMERVLDPLPIDVYIHLYEPNNPFAQPRDIEALNEWLHGVPQTIPFSRFFEDVVAVVQNQRGWTTLDDYTTFNAHYDVTERRITLSADNGDSAVLSESTLSDLWHYLRATGYCLPGNLPSGMDAHSGMVVAVLSRLDYICPVYVERPGTSPTGRSSAIRQVGLYIIPPVEHVSPTVAKVARS